MRAQVIEELGVGMPGAYEGLNAFEANLCANIDTCADETSGDVEAPTDWFARAGRRIVKTDDRGFWYVTRYDSVQAAKFEFEQLDQEYSEWNDEEEA